MQFLDGSFATATLAIGDLIRDHGAALPAVTYEAVAAFHPSPVDRIVNAAEALFAAGELATPAGVTLCAQLAHIAHANGWHRPPDDPERFGRIVATSRRRLGELTSEDVPPATDPAALPNFIPA